MGERRGGRKISWGEREQQGEVGGGQGRRVVFHFPNTLQAF